MEETQATAVINTMPDALASPQTIEKKRGQRILPLTREAICQIHSSNHITTLQGVVGSLLENSLDAGATKVDIEVDWRRGACTVDDNGIGIPTSEFAEHGGLGRMYCTSKRAPAGTRGDFHGSTGTFLAELAAMSLLSITSTRREANMSSTLTMHHGRFISRVNHSVNESEFATLHRRNGTSVSVRDLFGNMPVRVKQRSLVGDSAAEDGRSWADLKRCVVGLLLAWRHPCVVKLRDANSDIRALTIGSQSTGLTEKGLGQLDGKAAKFDLRDVLPVLFQSGFAPLESRNRWVPLSASTSAISLKGMICQDPAPSKQCQFIAIGITPCEATDGHHEFYDAVNKVFSHSGFGVIESLKDGETPNARHQPDGYTQEQLKAQKGVDRYPMFNLQLGFRSVGRSSHTEPDQMNDASVKALVDVLEAAVTTWLESNHFRPRKRRRREDDERKRTAAISPLQAARIPETPTKGNVSANASAHFPPAENGSSITATNATTGSSMKRRKIVDLSTEPTNARMTDLFKSPADIDTFSRIRAGKTRPKVQTPGPLPSSRKSSASPAVDKTLIPMESSHEHQQLPSRLRPQPPCIKPGEYNEITRPGSEVRVGNSDLSDVKSLSSDHFGSVDDTDILAAAENVLLTSGHNAAGGDDGFAAWTDPRTRQTFRVNSRTGVVLPMNQEPNGSVLGDEASSRQRAAIDTALSSAGKPLSLARRNAQIQEGPRTAASEDDKWLPGFLKEWNNPVFAKRQEPPILSASLDGPGLLELEKQRGCCSHDDQYSRAFAANSKARRDGTKLSKSALKDAKVIGQVDQKFILVRMPTSDDGHGEENNHNTLVLIDQHAASERVILETLLTDLFHPTTNAVQTSLLAHNTARSRPIVLEISSREHELFTRYRAHFTSWGIKYDLPLPPPPHLTSALEQQQSRRPKNEHRLIITSLPSPIAERCANFPALAIEMLRTEVWALEDGIRKAVPPTSKLCNQTPSEPFWITLLPHIPIELLAMLNSRSCRSAIMFNDPLTLPEAQHLIDQLSRCVFPFICAHGRTAMVPVMELGDANGEFLGFAGGGREAEEHGLEGWRGRERGVGVEGLREFIMK